MLVKRGGMMIPIIGSSLVACTLILERVWYFSRQQGRSQAEQMMALIAQNKFSEALAEAGRAPGLHTHVLAVGLLFARLRLLLQQEVTHGRLENSTKWLKERGLSSSMGEQ